MFEVGMLAVQQTMAAEVETLAGPRYARNTGNDAQRWGTQQGAVYVNGQKKNIKKPRVMRKVAGKHEELELETYSEFSKPTAMNEAIMAKFWRVYPLETTPVQSTRSLKGTASAKVLIVAER